jgi:putative membrane protein
MGIFGNGFGAVGADVFGVVMMAVLALIVVGIVLVVRGLTHQTHEHAHSRPWEALPQAPPPPAQPSRDALQILEERYARGEIDREEFLQRRQDIQGS